MLAERNAQIGRAVAVLKELSEDERTRLLEEAYQKARWDEELRLGAALAEGERKGVAKERLHIAQKMLRANMPAQTVALLAELPVEEIERLRAGMDA